jgi:nucleotidyltransferase substrate binding protein (TIGR01987 family)
VSKISTAELSKAIESLRISLDLHSQSIKDKSSKDLQLALRDSCIQRFEYSVEACWKTSMKILGSTTAAAMVAVREMARSDLVSSPDVWFKFIEARNETSHAYDENVARRVLQQIEKFLPEALKLLAKLDKLNV